MPQLRSMMILERLTLKLKKAEMSLGRLATERPVRSARAEWDDELVSADPH